MASMLLDYRDRLWGHVEVELLFDPTHQDIRRIIAASRDGMVRGVCHGGTLVVFDASRATHRIVRDALEWPQTCFDDDGCDLWIVPEGEEPFSPDWGILEDDPVRDGLRLVVGRNSAALEESRFFRWWASAAKDARGP